MLIKISQSAFDKIKEEILATQHERPKSLKEPDSLENDLEAKTILENRFGLKESDFLSKGVFTLVYLKDNLVYKFTRSKQDILKAILLKQLSTSIPEKYVKHIMYIEDFGFDEDAKAYYLIAEKLYRLSEMERALLLGSESPLENEFVATTLLTPTNLDFIVDIVKNNSNESPENLEKVDYLKHSYKQELLSLLTNKINSASFTNINSVPEDKKLITYKENAMLFAATITTAIFNFIKSKLNIKIKLNIINVARDISRLYMSNKRFPKKSKENQTYKKDAFGSDLFEFLNFLKTRGIFFDDTHTNNIMKRSNGDLVLSDVGLFRIT